MKAMNLPTEELDKWVEALRSGKHQQIQNRMADSTIPSSACCLHVAQMVNDGVPWKDGINKSVSHGGFGATMAGAIVSVSNTSYHNDETGFAGLNDLYGMSFDQIADLVETGEYVLMR